VTTSNRNPENFYDPNSANNPFEISAGDTSDAPIERKKTQLRTAPVKSMFVDDDAWETLDYSITNTDTSQASVAPSFPFDSHGVAMSTESHAAEVSPTQREIVKRTRTRDFYANNRSGTPTVPPLEPQQVTRTELDTIYSVDSAEVSSFPGFNESSPRPRPRTRDFHSKPRIASQSVPTSESQIVTSTETDTTPSVEILPIFNESIPRPKTQRVLANSATADVSLVTTSSVSQHSTKSDEIRNPEESPASYSFAMRTKSRDLSGISKTPFKGTAENSLENDVLGQLPENSPRVSMSTASPRPSVRRQASTTADTIAFSEQSDIVAQSPTKKVIIGRRPTLLDAVERSMRSDD